MFKTFPYILLLSVVLMLQLFVFDKLLISTALLPMVYISFIVLLPMQTSSAVMLFWGALVGAIFDVAMGMPGINSIATILICYMRLSIMEWTIGKELILLGGAPTIAKIGLRRFFRYMSLMVLLHSVVLFSVEYMNLEAWDFLLRRIVYSSLVSMFFVWIISKRFEQLLSRVN